MYNCNAQQKLLKVGLWYCAHLRRANQAPRKGGGVSAPLGESAFEAVYAPSKGRGGDRAAQDERRKGMPPSVRPPTALTLYLKETKQRLKRHPDFASASALQRHDIAILHWNTPGIDTQRKAELAESQRVALEVWADQTDAHTQHDAGHAQPSAAAAAAQRQEEEHGAGIATARLPERRVRSAPAPYTSDPPRQRCPPQAALCAAAASRACMHTHCLHAHPLPAARSRH